MDLTLREVNLRHPGGLEEAIEEVTADSIGTEKQFLCKRHGRLFVDCISMTRPDWSMPANCDGGCLYVDDLRIKEAVPIDKLDALYYIAGGDHS